MRRQPAPPRTKIRGDGGWRASCHAPDAYCRGQADTLQKSLNLDIILRNDLSVGVDFIVDVFRKFGRR
jgi:hypothetical protein